MTQQTTLVSDLSYVSVLCMNYNIIIAVCIHHRTGKIFMIVDRQTGLIYVSLFTNSLVNFDINIH